MYVAAELVASAEFTKANDGHFASRLPFRLSSCREEPGASGFGYHHAGARHAANSTIFTWINSTLLRPIPGGTETDDMVTIMRGERSEHPTPPFSYLDYRDLRDINRSFAGILAYHHDWVSLTGAGRPERVYGVLTSANYFDVLGVRPISRPRLPSR